MNNLKPKGPDGYIAPLLDAVPGVSELLILEFGKDEAPVQDLPSDAYRTLGSLRQFIEANGGKLRDPNTGNWVIASLDKWANADPNATLLLVTFRFTPDRNALSEEESTKLIRQKLDHAAAKALETKTTGPSTSEDSSK